MRATYRLDRISVAVTAGDQYGLTGSGYANVMPTLDFFALCNSPCLSVEPTVGNVCVEESWGAWHLVSNDPGTEGGTRRLCSLGRSAQLEQTLVLRQASLLQVMAGLISTTVAQGKADARVSVSGALTRIDVFRKS